MEEQRLDKWLWCARFFKTRGLASEAVKADRVTVNGLRAKPARTIKLGDVLTVKRPPYEYTMDVLGINKQRVPAGTIDTLFREHEQSRAKRESLATSIKHSAVISDRHGGKLSKKDRRERDKLKRLI